MSKMSNNKKCFKMDDVEMETEGLSNMPKLESSVLERLEIIGYSGPLLQPTALHSALEVGAKDKEYTILVKFLTNELRILLNIDEDINSITSIEDPTAINLMITSFIRELDCPFPVLTGGLLSERLNTYSDRLLLFNYLLDELMIARFLQEKKPEKKIELKLQETQEGSDMRLILQTLRFPKPPANITAKQLFDKIETTVPLVLKKANADLVGSGIFNGFLSDKQWDTLKEVQSDLHKEYSLRREMLLTRLDVTIQSFQWSDKTKGKEKSFESVYFDTRKRLNIAPEVDISDFIAARTDLAIYEKISSTSVRKNTKTPLNKVIIGQVPDRGGRSAEQEAPKPEMPSWMTRNAAPAGRGSPRGGGGGRGNQGNRGGFEGRGRGGYRNDQSGYQGRNSGGNGYDNNRGNGGFENNRGNGGFEGNQGFTNGGDGQRRYGGGNDYGGRGGGGARGGGSSDRYGGGYSGYGNDSYNYNRRDSGGYNEEYQQNKRPKTYDNFQANKTTYADQYVQESQHNQQYRRGGGRDNYQRGRGNYHNQRGGFR